MWLSNTVSGATAPRRVCPWRPQDLPPTMLLDLTLIERGSSEPWGGRKLAQHTTLGLAGIGTFLASATTYAPTAHRCDKLAPHTILRSRTTLVKKNLDFAARDNYDLLAVGCVCGLGGVTIPPHPRLNVDLEKCSSPRGHLRGAGATLSSGVRGNHYHSRRKHAGMQIPSFFPGGLAASISHM